ncbi:MAG: extracellular solute-binding protein family 1 [Devosia sp.]|nr:extracellular solute-binding protein family 1 [Devosia sp.]
MGIKLVYMHSQIRRPLRTALLAALVGSTALAPLASFGQDAIATGDAAVTAAGDFTLTIYINEPDTRLAALDALDAAFTEKYPNITIERIEKSYEELIASVRLVLSEPDAPCIVMADQGRDTDGVLISAGLVRPLGDYAEAYGWAIDPTSQWSEGGAIWGAGETYSVSPWYQMIGLYYNREKLAALGLEVPTTWEELLAVFEAAKAAGEVGLGFGNANQYPGSFIYEMVQNQIVSAQAVRDFVFGAEGATFVTPENIQAAKELQDLVNAGYITPGYDGISNDDAAAQFVNGDGVFLIDGNWSASFVAEAMGDNVGFMAIPPKAGNTHVATGGVSKPLHISASCPQPDVAAAYLNHLVSPESATVLAQFDDLPAGSAKLPDTASPVVKDILAAKDILLAEDGTVPFEDVAVSGFGDKFFAAIQELMAGRVTPEQFADTVEAAYKQ